MKDEFVDASILPKFVGAAQAGFKAHSAVPTDVESLADGTMKAPNHSMDRAAVNASRFSCAALCGAPD